MDSWKVQSALLPCTGSGYAQFASQHLLGNEYHKYNFIIPILVTLIPGYLRRLSCGEETTAVDFQAQTKRKWQKAEAIIGIAIIAPFVFRGWKIWGISPKSRRCIFALHSWFMPEESSYGSSCKGEPALSGQRTEARCGTAAATGLGHATSMQQASDCDCL